MGGGEVNIGKGSALTGANGALLPGMMNDLSGVSPLTSPLARGLGPPAASQPTTPTPAFGGNPSARAALGSFQQLVALGHGEVGGGKSMSRWALQSTPELAPWRGRGARRVGAPHPPVTCSSCCGTCCSCPEPSGTLDRWRRRRRSGCPRPSTPTQGKGKNVAPQESQAVWPPWEHRGPWLS